MELKSLKLNRHYWKCRILSEQAILLEPSGIDQQLVHIHHLAKTIEKLENEAIVDVVPAYQSLAIFFQNPIPTHDALINLLSSIEIPAIEDTSPIRHEIPVCYELGLDWDEVISYTGLAKEVIINQHHAKNYTVAMMGFIPGFVFLDGLDDALFVPRKESPRINIPAGSIGIGGDQTGMYSLESPGGWNIIGRSPTLFFDSTKSNPSFIQAGDSIQFKRISKKEFENG